MSLNNSYTHKPYTHKLYTHKLYTHKLTFEKPCQFSPVATFCDNHHPDWDFGNVQSSLR